MRYLFSTGVSVLLLLLPLGSFAQISPGPLAAAHAELEGVFNCTKCHELGNKVTNAKCLECHKEINTRIRQNKGYHAAPQVRKKDCFECHSEHHGRNFKMVRFDESSFNHDWTGYKLTGAHRTTDCRECHKPDNIQDPKYKTDKETYLGLGQECVSCHTDVHQNTLSQNCADCHNTRSFAISASFDHSKTDFALFGKHRQVECADCHRKETRNGRPFQQFADVPFANCTSCHTDPHHDNLGTDCKACHSELGWQAFAGQDRFDHTSTHFPLKGRHQNLDCWVCHDRDRNAGTVFQDRLGIRTTDCATCHKDIHDGRFGVNCAECHTEQGFRGRNAWDNFNHNRTDFPLAGKHQEVDCRKCHTGSMVDPLDHHACTSCHADFHDGQFVKNGAAPDCDACHTVEGFAGSTFGFDQHEKTAFPLQGAHMATPCFECHLSDAGKWEFASLDTRCVACHADVHQGEIGAQYYPEQDCAQCHSPESWFQHAFDHSQTNFLLEGAHLQQKCSGCHLRNEEYQYGKFKNLGTECLTCHADVHGAQFSDENNKTDCSRCHGFEDWSAEKFDHSQTNFQLEGRHAEIACSACHKPSVSNGETIIVYKIEKYACTDCH
ncbi:MAG: cytochrome c family protein [Bacteroidetes bacterium]|nr:MAG: cytochrome c family protein [Bacteroidota bacterium]